MAKETTVTTVTKPDPPKPIKPTMTVNERIQVSRFIARFAIALSALGIFAYVVHIMLGAQTELPASSKDLLNILIGALNIFAQYSFSQKGIQQNIKWRFSV